MEIFVDSPVVFKDTLKDLQGSKSFSKMLLRFCEDTSEVFPTKSPGIE